MSSGALSRLSGISTISASTDFLLIGLSAIIIGATGGAGKPLLREILASDAFSSVMEYGRHVTPLAYLLEGLPQNKLTQTIVDFDRLDESEVLKNGKWDVVFVT